LEMPVKCLKWQCLYWPGYWFSRGGGWREGLFNGHCIASTKD